MSSKFHLCWFCSSPQNSLLANHSSEKPRLAVQYCPALWYYEVREKHYEQREKQIPGFADVVCFPFMDTTLS